MVAESWFRSLWKAPKKTEEKERVGVLAFEIASLMSKIVHLWQSLSEKQISKITEEIRNTRGIRKLISEDEEFISQLISSEMIDSMVHVAKSVCRLTKRCSDSDMQRFEQLFDDMIRNGSDPVGWGFSMRKMEKKVKKMERFISINGTLYQEMELLGELEQMLKRLKSNSADPENVADYQKKMTWKRQEVKTIKEVSLWNKTYNYAILLLVRALFTLCARINDVFGVQPSSYKALDDGENGSFLKFASGPLHWLPPKPETSQGYFSGPLSGPRSGSLAFLSGPLVRKQPRNAANNAKTGWHFPLKKTHMRQVEPLKGFGNGNGNAVGNGYLNPGETFMTKRTRHLETVPETLGAAALSLHYANVIIVIERMAASPSLVGHESRDDLYGMLPASVRSVLRGRLVPTWRKKVCYDDVLAQEWKDQIAAILDWLAPLAHNMVKWQSERSFEQHSFLSRTNVLLVQTLFYADLDKTEAVITELLVGLNYVCRLGKECSAEVFKVCDSSSSFEEYLEMDT